MQVLGRYELLHEIASGGMATVYAARAVGVGGFEKLVAVKRMLPHLSGNRSFQRMFLDEGRIAANIRSPYVVSTLDLDRAEDGSLYIVLDLVLGCSLSELLMSCSERAEKLPASVVAEIGQQAARGLHDSHRATTALGEPLQIVHRDISPQNVLVGMDGSIRITDFGVAHALERLTKTQGVDIKGKLAYCSPEQAQGEPLDGRSDVFALGIVLWEALTIRRLFHQSDPKKVLDALLSGQVMDPRTYRPELPEALTSAVMKALALRPEDRFDDALQFAEALRAAVPHPARVDDLRALVDHHAGERIQSLKAKIEGAAHAPSELRESFAPPAVTGRHPPAQPAPAAGHPLRRVLVVAIVLGAVGATLAAVAWTQARSGASRAPGVPAAYEPSTLTGTLPTESARSPTESAGSRAEPDEPANDPDDGTPPASLNEEGAVVGVLESAERHVDPPAELERPRRRRPRRRRPRKPGANAR